ncbi:MAG: hypothetical protein ACOX6W_01765 [Lentisphaeria bacterium]|jgi:hypothetical protein
MQSERIQRTSKFEARLVIDGDEDLAIEVSFFDREAMREVQIVKLKDIARENFTYSSFLGALFTRDKLLKDVLKKPVRFDNKKSEPPIDYEQAYRNLWSRIYKSYSRSQDFAMLMLFKDILNEHNPYTNSYHEIIKARELYMLLDDFVGIPQHIRDDGPPNVLYLEECMRELIAEKKAVDPRSLQKLYKQKFPDEPPCRFGAFYFNQYQDIQQEYSK